MVDELALRVRQEVRERLGPNPTFEQRRDAEAELLSEVLWKREDEDLRESVATTDSVQINGKAYKRLEQPSSATYYGRWGQHFVEEPLYREVGVRNGPTVKPLELRVGIVARRMTPDLARIMGELSADGNSREVEHTMRIVGLFPPSRSFIEKRVKVMAAELETQVTALEQQSRAVTEIPGNVASMSCGLDRFSVYMEEPALPETIEKRSPRRRTKPYQRTPPPPKEYHYRKAWAGNVSIYPVTPPHRSNSWFPVSATECTASASIDDAPVTANPANLATAIPKFADIAAKTARWLSVSIHTRLAAHAGHAKCCRRTHATATRAMRVTRRVSTFAAAAL